MPAFYPLGALPLGAIPPHIVVAIAAGLVSGAPVLDTPAAAQVSALVADALAGASPALDSPPLFQVHALTASGLASAAPVLAAPPLVQVHALTASGLASAAPVLAAPALVQLHALAANALAAAAPVLGTPAALIIINATASALVSAAPVLAAPPLFQVHVLRTGEITIVLEWRPLGGLPLGAQPTIGDFLIVGPHLVSKAPLLGAPALQQVHHLVANGIATGAPVLGGEILISPSGIFVKHAGVWQAPLAYARHAGAWKDVVETWRHTEGAWQLIYKRAS